MTSAELGRGVQKRASGAGREGGHRVESSGFYSEETGTLWRVSNMRVTGWTEGPEESLWLTRVAQWKQVSVASLMWPMILHNLKKNPAQKKNSHRPYSIHTHTKNIHTTTRSPGRDKEGGILPQSLQKDPVLLFDIWPLQLRENKFLLFKPPSL